MLFAITTIRPKFKKKRFNDKEKEKKRDGDHFRIQTKSCITFTVGQFIIFIVLKCILHLRLGKLLHSALMSITFIEDITRRRVNF